MPSNEYGLHINQLHANKNHLFDKQFEVCMFCSIEPSVRISYEYCVSHCTMEKICLQSLEQSPLINAKIDF